MGVTHPYNDYLGRSGVCRLPIVRRTSGILKHNLQLRPVEASQSFLWDGAQAVSLFGTSFLLQTSYNEPKDITLKIAYRIVIKTLIQRMNSFVQRSLRVSVSGMNLYLLNA